jgi:hypothetical protein
LDDSSFGVESAYATVSEDVEFFDASSVLGASSETFEEKAKAEPKEKASKPFCKCGAGQMVLKKAAFGGWFFGCPLWTPDSECKHTVSLRTAGLRNPTPEL